MAIVIESGFATASEGADTFITKDLISTGAVHWVDSASGNNANSGNEASPLATLAQAVANATANNGDFIIIKAGHQETLTASLTISKAGLKIFGIGSGSTAPRFTVNAAIDGINLSGNSIELNNLYFPKGTTANNTSRINIDASNVRIKGCTFLCGAFDPSTITITANAFYPRIESCTFTVSEDGPDHGILIESALATGVVVQNSAFNGGSYNWDIAAIFSAVAHPNFLYDSLTLTGDAGIQHTATAKGILSNIIRGTGSQVQV